MESTLKILAEHQLLSGQFPTTVINGREGLLTSVNTIAPTYLICLILSEIRERGHSSQLLDKIVKNGVDFLARMCYVDPITGLRVWHFNAFYMPDWEETAWSAYLLFKQGLVSKRDLEPLRRIAYANETQERGVGVWIKDAYSADNRYNNVFDPVISLSVNEFLRRVFNEQSEPTENFFLQCKKENKSSLYYTDNIRDFVYFLLGAGSRPRRFNRDGYKLFHHGQRTGVWYASPDVFATAELFLAKSE
jgi:hypothetical protein